MNEYVVDHYYCAPCNTIHCFHPMEAKNYILSCFVNNTNWCEGKF